MSRSLRQSYPRSRRRTGHLGCRVLTWLSKERQDEIQQALHGPYSSMSGALAGGGEPGTGSRRRSPATLVTRCPLRLLPAEKALRGAAAASRLARA
jgi:hypothetical protein